MLNFIRGNIIGLFFPSETPAGIFKRHRRGPVNGKRRGKDQPEPSLSLSFSCAKEENANFPIFCMDSANNTGCVKCSWIKFMLWNSFAWCSWAKGLKGKKKSRGRLHMCCWAYTCIYLSPGLTRTLMASCRGPLVFKLSLPFSMAYSHSKPISRKVLLLASLPLGLRMMLPEAWFLTAAGESSAQGHLCSSTSFYMQQNLGIRQSRVFKPFFLFFLAYVWVFCVSVSWVGSLSVPGQEAWHFAPSQGDEVPL